MPSPVGHSLIGLAVGLAWLLPRGSRSELGTRLRACGPYIPWLLLAANLPDLDYLPGLLVGDLNRYHHLYTHTLGWAVVTSALLALGWRRFSAGSCAACFLLALTLQASHLLADIFTADGRAPYGIMALWPFRSEYVHAAITVFPMPRKATVGEMFQWYNVGVMAREALVVLPLWLAVAGWKLTAARKVEPGT